MTRVMRSIVLCGCVATCASGCASIGPKTIHHDQYEYNLAINKALNEQMLLNLAQMRYGDSPMFLRVSNVVNSYSIEEQLSALGYFSSGLLGDYQSVSPGLKYTDRPTITYVPLLGEKFAKSLLLPIPDTVILSFVDFGWSADSILRLCVSYVNDMDNRNVRVAEAVRIDKRFTPLVQVFRRLQDAKAIRRRLENVDDGVIEFMSFENRTGAPAIDRDIALVKELLGLKPDASEYRVGHSPEGSRDTEIIIRGRSLYEILEAIAAEIDVPQDDVEKKRVLPTPDFATLGESEPGPLIRIHSSPEKPSNAPVAVRYRNSWFWVDDSDYRSKKLFSVLTALFMITESGTGDFVPVVTIPAG